MFSAMSDAKVSDGSQPPMTSCLFLYHGRHESRLASFYQGLSPQQEPGRSLGVPLALERRVKVPLPSEERLSRDAVSRVEPLNRQSDRWGLPLRPTQEEGEGRGEEEFSTVERPSLRLSPHTFLVGREGSNPATRFMERVTVQERTNLRSFFRNLARPA